MITLLNQPWTERLGWTLLHFLWQGILVAALYAFARALAGRRLSARGRYALARDIAQGEAQRPRTDGEKVVIVSSHAARGLADARVIQGRERRPCLRKQLLLDRLSDLHLTL